MTILSVNAKEELKEYLTPCSFIVFSCKITLIKRSERLKESILFARESSTGSFHKKDPL
jgi:hypothetical protein